MTVNFVAFGGGAAVAASNSSDTWTATYTIVEGTIDTTNVNVSVTATDDGGNATTTADSTNATVDNQTPTVTITGAPASADEGDLISVGSTTDEAGTFLWSTSGGPSTDGGTVATTYDVTPTDNGSYTVTLMVTDDVGNIGVANAMITVNNVAPVADDDTESANEDVVTNVAAPGVLDGDTDVGAADTLNVNVGNSDSTSTQGATVTLMSDGSFDYDLRGVASIETLGAGEMLTDSFDYEVNDDDGGLDTGTVTINVTGVNDAPVITSTTQITTLASIDANDTGGVQGDSILDFAVPRITDADGTAIFGIAIVGTSAGATGGSWEFSTDSGASWSAVPSVSNTSALHLIADGTTRVRLVPDGSSVGNGTITFRAWDQTNAATNGMTADASMAGGQTAYSTNTVQARVVVGAVANDAPAANDDLGLSVSEGGTLNLAAAGVLANDSDQDAGATLQASPVSSTAHGTLTLNSDGSLSYVADGSALDSLADGESSFQTFTYRATDGSAFSDIAVAGITVNGQNDAPIANDATFSIAENTMMSVSVGSVSASDVDTSDTLMYSITDGNTDTAFAIDAMSGEITVANPIALDREVRSSFSLEITVSDGSLSDTADVTVHLTGVNEATPTITSSAAASVVENTTSVLTVTATDSDMPAETLTFGITNSGADDSLFSIDSSTGVLTFSSAPDFESPGDANGDNVYEVEVSVSDGTNTATQTVSATVTGTDDNAPVITSSASASVAENTTAVQTVAATDADAPGDTLTFGITGSGADDALFDIDSMSGALTFKIAPDAETPSDANGDNVYHVEVSANDGTTTSTQTVAVTVTGVNDNGPSITSSSSASIVENTTAVQTVTGSDSDSPADTLTFGITSSGADDSLFSIDSSTGVLTFVSAPDFESPGDANGDNVYEVEVSVNDGATTATQTVNVTVTGTEDNAPTITSTSTPSVAENTTAVVTVTASDADLPGDTLSYCISGDGGSANADNGLFSINSSTGTLSFVNAPDFENPADSDGDNDYQVSVLASDGTTTVMQTLTVSVTGVDDNAPFITSSATASIAENTTAVQTVAATDADAPGDTLTFGITGSGADGALFDIDSMSGALTFKIAPDAETPGDTNGDNVYHVEVSANDGTTTATQTVAVTVTGVNDNGPSITSSPNTSLAENTTSVLTVTATDSDMPAETLTFGITNSGADDSLFSIDSSTGVLTFSSAPDFENSGDANADNVYVVEVSVSDGATTEVQVVSATVTGVDDNAPVITSSATASVAENTTAVQTVAATDADAPGDTLTFGVTGSGADDALFDIDSMSGSLTFKIAPDAENAGDSNGDNVYHVEVSATDGTMTSTQTVAVSVTGANDNTPVITSSASASVVENSPHALTVTATDSDDPADILSIGITGSAADNALFSIDSSTGVLTFNSAPDFDNAGDANGDNVYEVEVSVSDGTNSATQTISITVTGEEDNAPTITSSSTPSVAENTTAVVTVTASDADLPGDTLSFGISGDGGAANADNGLFTINSSTGELSFANAPDFEAPADSDGDNDYLVRVWASDGTTRVSQNLTVSVTGANDNVPTITSDDAFNVPAVGTAVLTVSATDDDLPGDSLSFGITGSGADDARFTIGSMSGELTFLADPASAADADMDGVYEVQVSANDGANTVTQDILVTVVSPEVGVAVSDEGELVIADLAGTDNHLAVSYDAATGEYVVSSAMPVLSLGTLTIDSIDTPSDALPTNEVRIDELLVTDSVIVLLGDGDDLLNASTMDIRMHVMGGDGNDRIVTGMGDDTIDGGAGDDRVNGRAGDDSINTGDGNDTALGGAGRDEIEGGDGDDILRGQSGSDEIDGGLGIDMIRGGAGSNEIADDVAGTVTVDGDSATSDRGDDIRHASGGVLLTGSDDADIFNAAMATIPVWIEAEGGDDVITGSPQDDLLFGGDGNDAILGGDGDDTIDGGDGDDDIMGDDGDDAIRGGLGNDRLNGNQGHDTMLGSDGNDSLFGGGQADLLLGEDGLDHVRGQSGDDALTGAGNGSVRVNPGDNVKGGAGTNVIDDAFSFDFDALLPTDD